MKAESEFSVYFKVFVYGTLKREEPNHHWLTNPEHGHSRFLGTGQTANKYPLVIASKYNIPFLLDVPGLGNNVVGEVYEVDEKMLANLDILEGYPTYYARRIEEINLYDTRVERCWVYFLNAHKPKLLELPMLTSYSSNGNHGLVYVERYKRDPLINYKSEVSTSHHGNQNL